MRTKTLKGFKLLAWSRPNAQPFHVTMPLGESGDGCWTEAMAKEAYEVLEYCLGWQVQIVRLYYDAADLCV